MEINIKDKNGWTALHCASEIFYLDICEYLINNGARVNEVTSSFTIPLHYLVKNNSNDELTWKKFEEVMNLMLREGADINARDIHLQTPLHRATTRDEKCVRFLIDNGAKINAVDEFHFLFYYFFIFYIIIIYSLMTIVLP